MLKVRCKECKVELECIHNEVKCCGCSNMTTIKENTITAVDLSKVVMLNSIDKEVKNKNLLSRDDVLWQEERRQRKVRKLDFEVR